MLQILTSALGRVDYVKNDIITNYSQLTRFTRVLIKMTRTQRWEIYFCRSRGFLDSSVTLTRVANVVCVRIQVHPDDRPRRTCEKPASHVVIPPAILNTGKRRTGDWITDHDRKEASIRRVIIVLAFLDPALLSIRSIRAGWFAKSVFPRPRIWIELLYHMKNCFES